MSRRRRAYLNALDVAVVSLHWAASKWSGFPRVQEELRHLANELSDRAKAIKRRTSDVSEVPLDEVPTERVTMLYGPDSMPPPKPSPEKKQ